MKQDGMGYESAKGFASYDYCPFFFFLPCVRVRVSKEETVQPHVSSDTASMKGTQQSL